MNENKNFKETFGYKYCTVLRKKGLYLPDKNISLEGVSKNIHTYYVQRNFRTGMYTALSKKPTHSSSGVCFLKEPIEFLKGQKFFSLQDTGSFVIDEDLKTEEEFYSFFGVRLTLDKQISLAEEKRVVVKGSQEDSEDTIEKEKTTSKTDDEYYAAPETTNPS